MNCVRDMVISSAFFNISSYTRLISCLNGLYSIAVSSKKENCNICSDTKFS